MTILDSLFYFLTVLIMGLALASVVSRNILRSVIYLMGVLVLTAGLYLMLNAQFLAGVQVLVYVGGIVVLLVFAVMLTKTQDLLEEHPSFARQIVGAIVSAGFFGMVLKVLRSTEFPAPLPASAPGADISNLGKAFLDPGAQGYVLPFELISLLLLAVLVGGMVLAKKREGSPS